MPARFYLGFYFLEDIPPTSCADILGSDLLAYLLEYDLHELFRALFVRDVPTFCKTDKLPATGTAKRPGRGGWRSGNIAILSDKTASRETTVQNSNRADRRVALEQCKTCFHDHTQIMLPLY